MAVATDPRLEEIQKIARGRGVEFFFAQFVDMYGRPSAKLVPAANLDDLATDGAGFAGFAAGEIGQLPSDPDIAAMPDLSTLTLVPWQQNLARFACDITVDGRPWPYCPRAALRRALEALRREGYTMMVGTEAEHFLVTRLADGTIVREPAQAPVGARLEVVVARGLLGTRVEEARGDDGEELLH